jgi:hypothetical protein
MEEVADEVDIGVGVMKHIYGYDCVNCGHQIGMCSECGLPTQTEGTMHKCVVMSIEEFKKQYPERDPFQ